MAGRAVEELKELAELTGSLVGARRVCWTDEWAKARSWLRGKLEEIGGLEVASDEARNLWATAPGDSERAVLLGGHIDYVPDGCWLDGCLNTIAGVSVDDNRLETLLRGRGEEVEAFDVAWVMSSQEHQATNADCVLTGKIYTLDHSRREVEGVAICDGRIVYAGDAREAVHRGGPGAEVIDVLGD